MVMRLGGCGSLGVVGCLRVCGNSIPSDGLRLRSPRPSFDTSCYIGTDHDRRVFKMRLFSILLIVLNGLAGCELAGAHRPNIVTIPGGSAGSTCFSDTDCIGYQ